MILCEFYKLISSPHPIPILYSRIHTFHICFNSDTFPYLPEDHAILYTRPWLYTLTYNWSRGRNWTTKPSLSVLFWQPISPSLFVPFHIENLKVSTKPFEKWHYFRPLPMVKKDFFFLLFEGIAGFCYGSKYGHSLKGKKKQQN